MKRKLLQRELEKQLVSNTHKQGLLFSQALDLFSQMYNYQENME